MGSSWCLSGIEPLTPPPGPAQPLVSYTVPPRSPATWFWPLAPEWLALVTARCSRHPQGGRSLHHPSPRACAIAQVPVRPLQPLPSWRPRIWKSQKEQQVPGSGHSPQSTWLLAQPRPRA